MQITRDWKTMEFDAAMQSKYIDLTEAQQGKLRNLDKVCLTFLTKMSQHSLLTAAFDEGIKSLKKEIYQMEEEFNRILFDSLQKDTSTGVKYGIGETLEIMLNAMPEGEHLPALSAYVDYKRVTLNGVIEQSFWTAIKNIILMPKKHDDFFDKQTLEVA